MTYFCCLIWKCQISQLGQSLYNFVRLWEILFKLSVQRKDMYRPQNSIHLSNASCTKVKVNTANLWIHPYLSSRWLWNTILWIYYKIHICNNHHFSRIGLVLIFWSTWLWTPWISAVLWKLIFTEYIELIFLQSILVYTFVLLLSSLYESQCSYLRYRQNPS